VYEKDHHVDAEPHVMIGVRKPFRSVRSNPRAWSRFRETSLRQRARTSASLRNTLGAVAAWLLVASPAAAQDFTVIGTSLQKRVDGALAMMQYSVSPDVTTSSLSIQSGESDVNGLFMTQLGGGFTWSKTFPLYLEGNAAYSRYDPVFVLSDGTETRRVQVRWNSLVGTVGAGWDFPVAPELVLRPIANFTLGHVESDLSVAGRLIQGETGRDIDFLDNGRMNAVGYGGSLMLDYEHYREAYEIDVEVRLTDIYMRNFGGTSEAVQGSAYAQTLGVWSRWRAPTGLRSLDRPVRYVLEYAFTHYFGPDGDMLGFNNLNSVGTGLELDVGRWDTFVSRVRLMGRYRFGANVSGWAVSLGISF
jgi:hypothetical protein